MLKAVVTHRREPFGAEVSCVEVEAGRTLLEVAPKEGIVICRVNGGPRFVPRAAWATTRVSPGDVVEMIEYPGQGGSGGGPLQLVLGGLTSILAGPQAFIAYFASTVINSLMTDRDRKDELKRESPTYSTGLAANTPRLFQPIPKLCGRMRFFPPYAAEPYREIDENGDEYFYALFAVTIDRLQVERTQIDDTDITHFQNVVAVRYLEPGEAPIDVKPNVFNSLEVNGQEMLTGRIIGGISACPPLNTVEQIGIDILMPYGGGIADEGGNLSNITLRWRVEIAELNQFGSRISPWSILATEERSVAAREPQRWTYTYDVDPPRRVEVRLVRIDIKSNNANHLSDAVWGAMRGYIAEDVPLNENVTHLEVVIRSSQQLSPAAQGRVAVVGTGIVRELLEDGTFGDEIASRNAADYLADLWLSQTWGEGLEEAQVDLETLAYLRGVWAARQDRFDYIFETAIDVDEAANIIASSGRARAFKRANVRSVWRDELVTLPRTAFTTRNTVPGSMVETEELPRERTPDGVIVEYFDSRGWNYGRPIDCPCPGVTSMVDPIRIRLAGITGRTHATREGLFEAAKIAYRRRVRSCTTEMQGSLPAFGSALKWQSEHTRWQSGDVVEWDPETLVARLSEPVDWTGGAKQILFITDDGTLTEAIAVTPGALTTEVLLAEAPSFDPITEDGTRDRTIYMLGTATVDDELVVVSSIEDGGKEEGVQLYDVTGFVDDPRVHAVDNELLPNPGEIQDPIDLTPGESGGGLVPVVNILDRVTGTTSPATMSYHFNMDGTAGDTFNTGGAYERFEDQWLYQSPSEPSDVAQFEVFFELIHQEGDVSGVEHMGAWLPIDQNFVFSATNPGGVPAIIEFNIIVRDVATEIEQDRAHILVGVGEHVGG